MTVLVGFVVTPILTHQLGIVRYGVWALIGSLIPFLELLELGFANVTVAFVGRHLELEEDDKVSATINTSFLILSVLGLLAFVGVLIFTIFLPDIITTIPKDLVGQAQFLLLLLAFDMALSIPMDTFGGAIVAMQRFDLLNFSLVTVLVLQAIGWVIVLALHGGLVALGVVTVVISLLGQVSRLLIFRHLLPWFRLSLRRFDRGLLRALTTLSGWFSLVQISDAVIALSDVLIVGAVAGVEAAAVYAVALRLGPLPFRIVQPRTYTLFPTAAELGARGDESGLRDRTDQVVRFALYLSAPVAIALGFLAGPAVEAWVGPLYREAATIIGLLCLAGVIQGWAFTVRMALNGSRRPKLPAVFYGLEAVLHVVLGIVLTSRYGPIGMAEAVLIGVVTMEGMLLLPLAYRQLGDRFSRRAIGFGRALAAPALATGVLGWVLGRPSGPLFSFTNRHGRIAGLAVVGVAGLGLLVVFYALLLLSMPAIERRPLLARCKVWLGRVGDRSTEVADPISPDGDEDARVLLKDAQFVVDTGWWRTGGRASANAMATMVNSESGQAESPSRGEDDMSNEVAPSTGVKSVAEWLGPADRALSSWTGVKSVARWLGPADRPLFAWLDLPDDNRIVGAVVVFPTIGLEGDYSARAVRDLAHRLATFRWAVLRVDYPGTGDSYGTWTDPGLVADWRRSVREAVEFAQALHAPRVAVVGLRLGATLAASELGDELNVDDVVLWDPCATGKGFLREQRALWAFRREQAIEWGTLREGEAWGSGDTTQDGSFEAPGVMFSAQSVSDLQALAIDPGDQRLASRELVLTREGRKLDRVLTARRELPWVEFSEIAGQELLLDADAVIPERTLGYILDWLNERAGEAIRIEPPELPVAATFRTTGGTGVLERPLAIGPTGLFGMLCEPEVSTERPAPTVIFLNAGRIGHQGPARLWVDLARSWSSEGLRCLRVDLSGLGLSPTRPGRTENVEFPADALDDLRDVRRAVDAEFGSQVVLVGLCSGGYHAVESALDEPVASLCLINPALTYYRWNRHPYRRFEPDEGEGFTDRQAWGATRPWVSNAMLRLAPLRDAVRKVPGAWWILKRLLVTASPGRTFERLTASGIGVLVVAGSDEARQLQQGEPRRYRSLARKGSFHLETVPGLEHTLLERTGRDRVSALLHASLVGVFPDQKSPAGPAPGRLESIPHLP